jgi:hypothetical protein
VRLGGVAAATGGTGTPADSTAGPLAASGESVGAFVLHVAGVALHPVPDNLVVAAALTLFRSGEEPPIIPIAAETASEAVARHGHGTRALP